MKMASQESRSIDLRADVKYSSENLKWELGSAASDVGGKAGGLLNGALYVYAGPLSHL